MVAAESRQFDGPYELGSQQLGAVFGAQPLTCDSMLTMHWSTVHDVFESQFGPPSVTRIAYVLPGSACSVG